MILATEKREKISMGLGMTNSAMIGAEIEKALPNRLQIPKAVPHSVIGNINGVET